MSLIDKTNKGDLLGIARSLFIEVPEGATLPEIRALMHAENVSDEDILGVEIVPEIDPNAPLVSEADGNKITTASLRAEEEAKLTPVTTAPAVVASDLATPVDDSVLLKYERQNPTFQILTYQFSKEHPFSLVKAADADYIVRNITGFRPALQSEAQEFYS